MNFIATRTVFGPPKGRHGPAPTDYLLKSVEWARTAPEVLFARNNNYDIFNKVYLELGPFPDIYYRKAVILEVLRVLGGFESDWNPKEGVDTSRLGADTPENSEAGLWQASYDARLLDVSLKDCLARYDVHDGVTFQRKLKFDFNFAIEFEVLLLRIDVKNFHRLHNGPLYKDNERLAIRASLRGASHSIYPWLSRAAVDEFRTLVS